MGSVSVDKLPAAGGVRAKSTTNLDDHSTLISSCDLDLLARWRNHRSPPVRTAASRNALARRRAERAVFLHSVFMKTLCQARVIT